jgi:Domain of unknown function (DUF5606)
MNLKDIAAISGKPGLYRVFKPSRNGVILESLDDKKTKLTASLSHRVSLLKEVSMYTTSTEGSLLLEKIMANVLAVHGTKLQVGTSNQELMQFLETVLPDYDRNQVYPSDVKKLVSWFGILQTYAPEVFTTPSDGEAKAQPETPSAEVQEAPAPPQE